MDTSKIVVTKVDLGASIALSSRFPVYSYQARNLKEMVTVLISSSNEILSSPLVLRHYSMSAAWCFMQAQHNK